MQETNLTALFTDIADAIREKESSSEPIQASTFPTRIANLPSGGYNPQSVQELETAEQEVCNSFRDYLKQISNNYNYITDGDATLYTPNASCTMYVIRKRNNYFQVMWFPDALFKTVGNSLIRTQHFVINTSSVNLGFIASPTYNVENYEIKAYATANNIPTLEEAINAIKSNQTVYTQTSSFWDWSVQEYSVNYVIPCTNAPFFQDDNVTPKTMQKISSNETIMVIQ